MSRFLLFAFVALFACDQSFAEVKTYDLTLRLVAKTLVPSPRVVRVKATGTMTFDDETGACTFMVTEDAGIILQSSDDCLMGRSDRRFAIARTSFNAVTSVGSDPVYSGMAFFSGTFSRDFNRFSGQFDAVADSFGAAPAGFTINSGTMRAKAR